MNAVHRSSVMVTRLVVAAVLLSGCSSQPSPSQPAVPQSITNGPAELPNPPVQTPTAPGVEQAAPAAVVAKPIPLSEPSKTAAVDDSAVSQNVLQIDPQNLKKLDDLYFAKLMYREESAAFRDGIKNLRNEIPEVSIALSDEPIKWNTIDATRLSPTLNTGKHLLSLFKFRSPLDRPADLHWAFAVQEGLGRWYILPAKGEMKGFESFKVERNLKVSDVPLPPGSPFVFQELTGGHILPGEEYFIWYVPPDGADNRIYVALRLTPAGTHSLGETAADIRQSLGLKAEPLAFPQTTEGLRNAYAAAHRMVHYKPEDSDGLKQLLRSVWEQLPEIQVATESGMPVWNHVTPNLSFRFHAVRFKSALELPADIHWSYVVANEPLRWGLISQEGDLPEPNTYAVEVNCPIPGISNPDKNLAIFQSLLKGQILSGTEYAIWFAPAEGALPDFDLAVRLSPEGTLEKADDSKRDRRPQRWQGNSSRPRTNVQSASRALGLDIPAFPSPERVVAALKRCTRLIAEDKQTSWQFNRLLQFAAPGLPKLESDGENARWNRIDLNQDGFGIAAYRVGEGEISRGRMTFLLARPQTTVSQFNQPIRVYYDTSRETVVPKPATVTWGIIEPDWPGIYLPYRFSENDVTPMGLPIPPNSALDVNLYNDWSFPRDDPYVFVVSPPDASPISVHVAVKIEAKPTTVIPRDVVSAVKYMGFRSAIPENTGEILGKHTNMVAIIQFAGDGELVSSSYDRGVKWWDLKKMKEEARNDPRMAHGVVKAFTSDRSRLAALEYDARTITIHDARTMEQQALLTIPDERIPQFYCFSPNGQSLLGSFGGSDNDGSDGVLCKSVIYVWNLQQPGPPQGREYPKSEPIRTASWLPDGRIVTAGSQQDASVKSLLSSGIGGARSGFKIPLHTGEIQFLDGSTLKSQEKLTEEGADWVSIEVSADGTRMGTLARTGLITVTDLKSLQPVVSLPQDGFGQALSLSGNGHRVASISAEGNVRVWDLDSRRLLSIGSGRVPPARAVAISRLGDKIALGGNDGTIRMYSVTPPGAHGVQGSNPDVMSDSIGLQLNWIPSGEFTMGVSESLVSAGPGEADGLPRHAVRITRPFYLGRYEVTVAQFRKFVEATSYRTTAETSRKGGSHVFASGEGFRDDSKLNWKNPGFPQEADHPVVQVSYHDAIAFCEWLSKKEQARYRLPTEAEWEYACRAGTSSKYYHGSGNFAFRASNVADGELIKAYGGAFDGAFGNSDGSAYTARVGSYMPNGFALFDMHGNVWEWCSDWYGPKYYATSPLEDPPGAKEGADRILRGGSFLFGPSASAWREAGPPDQVRSHIGFRVVREIP